MVAFTHNDEKKNMVFLAFQGKIGIMFTQWMFIPPRITNSICSEFGPIAGFDGMSLQPQMLDHATGVQICLEFFGPQPQI